MYAAGYYSVDFTQPHDQEFKIFNDPTTGFQALGLISQNLEKQPSVLIIQGIDEAIDDLSGVDPRGVGFKQFEANQAAIAQLLGARDALDPAKNNTLIGNEQANTAHRAEGNDIIGGNGGNDTLHGSTGYNAISNENLCKFRSAPQFTLMQKARMN